MKVILWSNGMFTVFDADGEQIPELQGRLTKAGPKIYSRIDEITNFQMGDWDNGVVDATVSKLKCLLNFIAEPAELTAGDREAAERIVNKISDKILGSILRLDSVGADNFRIATGEIAAALSAARGNREDLEEDNRQLREQRAAALKDYWEAEARIKELEDAGREAKQALLIARRQIGDRPESQRIIKKAIDHLTAVGIAALTPEGVKE